MKRLYQSGFKLIIIFVGITAVIILFGLNFYNRQREEIRKEKYDDLSAIATLKASQIVNWRNERLGDANVIAESFIFSDAVINWQENPSDKMLREKVFNSLQLTLQFHQYKSVLLIDTSGRVLISVEDTLKYLGEKTLAFFREAVKNKTTIISDIYYCDICSDIHLDVVSPLFDKGKLIGGVLFRINPQQFLYPLIQSWPTPSKSSESLLITKEGNEVVYINELRHRKNTILKLRIKIDNSNINVPAVAAVYGKTGIVEGVDYRGVPVLSDTRKIPDSPWWMIVKADLEEVYAQSREKAMYISFFIGMLILFFGSGIFWLWKNQRKTLYILEAQNKYELQAVEMAERKRAEETLQASKDYLENILNNIGDPVFVKNDQSRMLLANDAFCSLFGLSRDNIIGKTLAEDVTPEEQEHFLKIDKQVFSDGVENLCEESLTVEGKESLTILTKKNRYIDENDNKFLIGVIRDITERKRAEDALKENEELLSLFVEHSPIHAYIKEVTQNESRVLKASESFSEMLGIHSWEMIGKTMEELFPAEFAKQITADNWKVVSGGEILKLDEELNGRYYNTIKFPIIMGDKYLLAGYTIDITDRKKAEEVSKESEEKFRLFFENALIGKSITGIDGSLKVNKAFCEMLGYTEDELKNINWKEITHPDDIQESAEVVKSIIDGKTNSAKFEKRYIHKNGSTVWTYVSTIIHRDSNGKPMFFITTTLDLTERKKAENEVIVERDFSETALSSLPGVFYLISKEGKFLRVNENFVNVSGYTFEEFKTISAVDLFEGQEKELIEKNINEVFVSGKTEVEAKIVSKNGTKTSYLFTGKLIEIEGKPCLIGMGIDITERKKAEEALRVSEDKFRSIFENMDSASCFDKVIFEEGIATDYIVFDVNPAYERILNISKKDLVGKLASEIYQTKDIPFLETYARVAVTGNPETFESYFAPAGIYLQITASQPAPGMFSTVFTDITERKQAEAKLQASETRYRRLFESSKDGILILDAESGEIVDVNPFLIDMLGFSHTELLGRELWEIGTFRNIVESKDAFIELQSKEYIRFEDMPMETKAGKSIAVEFISNVYLVDNAKVIQCDIRDISERKLAEAEIKKLNEELELRVIQRTSQLEAANKELEAFSYSVSHDLRSPLRALDGFAKILLEDYSASLDSEGKRYLNIITDNSKNMAQLIDDLLAFSRLSRQEIQHAKIDMYKLAKAVYEETVQDANITNIEFKLENIPAAYGDYSMVKQVWRNLIGNAIKFSSTKEKRIIEIGNRIEGTENIYYVKDNGVGFDMEYKEKLFGVFQRLQSKNEFEGTGVGLAIVQRITHRLGGRVWAEGKINEGATFYFTLLNKIN